MALSECSLEMLQYLKLKSVEELFSDIPASVRTDGLRLPDGLTELELRRELEAMMAVNRTVSQQPTFLGAGVYHHFIPAAVKTIVMRSEFITSYTPYQPEISQGMLQALFEYQSFMTELTGMDAVNCSMYDASTALGEAVLMSYRLSGGKKFLISRAISPEKKLVAQTYARGADIQLTEVGYDPMTGSVDLEDLESKMDPDVSGFYFESPNFFGLIEPGAAEIRNILGAKTMVVGVNPMVLALVKPPADYGADIVVGDAQVFGSSMSLGGPMIGLFGCKMEHVRKMPGRLIGLTVDSDNRRSYCMTLQTREQNIRRGKATSNICSNEALLAVASAAYLSLVGKSGLKDIAAKNIEHAYLLASRIGSLKGFKAPHFKGTHFNEFVVTSEIDPNRIHEELLSNGIHGGFPLGKDFPELKNSVLYATTEMHTKGDHDRLVNALEAVR
ncbi:MAG: glycine dehydrogenase (aminomethyl-transferring) [Euryarchaeota archaeon RBG_13_57_23]|nr:MAG: glycine dehydrogenase (aminomethyl-transferring) [Euryarchaeota archaeon RBG_13_57_23]